MEGGKLKLSILPEVFAICRLKKDAPFPDWALAGSFSSLTRTEEEFSVVCPQDNLPEGITSEKGWRGLKVEGVLDFSQVGVLTSLTAPLAQAGISILAISTYQTDYLMVKEEHLKKAVRVLSQEGHQVR